MLHVNVHLERIGDYCVTIAKLVKLAPTVAPDRHAHRRLRGDGRPRRGDGPVALDAFASRNVEQAETLVDLDELIDRANRRFVQHVLSFGRDPKLHEWGLRMILVSRCFERIGDHAVDIGERIAYLATASSASSRTPRTRPTRSYAGRGAVSSLVMRRVAARRAPNAAPR